MTTAALPKMKQVHSWYPLILFSSSSLISLSYYSKNSVLVHIYNAYMELNGPDDPVKPSEKLMTLVSEVKEDVKNLTSDYTPVESIIIPGIKTYHSGALGTWAGGVIGLPAFFNFDTTADVDNKIMKAGQDINETSLEELHDCFILTDKAKKFGIAREILSVNSYKTYYNAALPVTLGYAVAFLTEHLNSKSLFTNKTTRGLFYGLMTAAWASTWKTVYSLLRNNFETGLNKDLVTLGQEYVEGGLEFYSKDLERRRHQLEFINQTTHYIYNFESICDKVSALKEISLQSKIEFYKSKLQQESKIQNKELEETILEED